MRLICTGPLALLFLFLTPRVGQAQVTTAPVPDSSPQSVFSISSLGSTNAKVLALSTTPIRIFCGNTLLGTATGFFFEAQDESRAFLITNRHVVIQDPRPGQSGGQYPDRLVLSLHNDDADLTHFVDYPVALYRTTRSSSGGETKERLWREIDPATDVVAIEVNRSEMRHFAIGLFRPDDLLPREVSLSLGDPLVVIGYPLGFSDQRYNLPVAREGTVASAFRIPFQGQRLFLADARLHPGTSGSPVVTRPAQVFIEKGLLKYNAEEPVAHLVGINSGEVPNLNLNAIWYADIILELIK